MSHGGSGGGGFGHGASGHMGHHGSIQGPNVDPNWTGTIVRSEEGDWRWRWFHSLSSGQVGGLFFLGFILWLFVVYGTSHRPGSSSKLADLKNFPSNKYEYSIRAASGQQAWEREPTKPMEHTFTAPERGNNSRLALPESMARQGMSARLFSNRQTQSQAHAATQAMAQALPSFSNTQRRFSLPPPEDLLAIDEFQARPFNAAFGKARGSTFAIGNQTASAAKQPWLLNLASTQTRVDTGGSLGEIAERRSGNSAVATKLAAVKGMSLVSKTSPLTAVKAPNPGNTFSSGQNPGRTIVQGGNTFFHAITQATADGIMRTKLVVSR